MSVKQHVVYRNFMSIVTIKGFVRKELLGKVFLFCSVATSFYIVNLMFLCSTLLVNFAALEANSRTPHLKTLHSGKVRGQIWTFLKLELEVRGVIKN